MGDVNRFIPDQMRSIGSGHNFISQASQKALVRLTSDQGKLALALPGYLGGGFAVFIGSLVLLFALPSFGRQGEYGYLLSPAAGAVLFMLLGLEGITGAAFGAVCSRAKSLLVFCGILALPSLAFFILFREWPACAILIIIAALSWAAFRAERVPAILLLAGLIGFPLGQASMTFLPYGWKTWAVSGSLMTFSWLLLAGKNYLSSLPLLYTESGSAKLSGYALYSLLSLALLLSVVAALIQVPNESADIASKSSGDANVKDPTAGLWCFNGSNSGNEALSDCDCQNSGFEKPSCWDSICSSGETKAVILSPGDVQTYTWGVPVGFVASACGKGPFKIRWDSSIDGQIGVAESFEADNLSVGWHTITFTITDSDGATCSDQIEIGIAEPWACGNVKPRPKYYPVDTPCKDIWPDATEVCQEFEVCHPGLDYIVADAVNCCDGSSAGSEACAFARNNAEGDKKRCRGLYIIKAFGPEGKYMKGYALFKACCSGYPECTRTCGLDLAGTCAFRGEFNRNVSNLSCRPETWGLQAWLSDQNMSLNSGSIGILPTHATVNMLGTGVCADYSAAVVTALRKAGYSRQEAFYTASTGYDLPLLGNHPGHAYGLALLPGESKYHFVDTTGNGEGINLEGVPRYFWFNGCFLGQPVKIRIFDWWVGYCNRKSEYSFNDAGYFRTPERERVVGC